MSLRSFLAPIQPKHFLWLAIAVLTLAVVASGYVILKATTNLIAGDSQTEIKIVSTEDEEDPNHGEHKEIINGEEVTVIDLTLDEEETPVFDNLCLMSKNGWNLEVWTDGSVTEPHAAIEIGVRLTRPEEEVKIAPKAQIFVQLNGVRGGQPSFRNNFEREFAKVHRKSLGIANPDFGRTALTKPRDGWEAILNPFPTPEHPKAWTVKALGKYSLKVDVRLQDGTQFVSPSLPIEVMDRRELRHPGGLENVVEPVQFISMPAALRTTQSPLFPKMLVPASDKPPCRRPRQDR
jgi:hypothetical protein